MNLEHHFAHIYTVQPFFRHIQHAKIIDVPLDTGHDGVGVRALLGTLVALLDNDDLLTGLTAREDDGNLSGLVDCNY
jgi:hypothetical protein